MTTHKSKLAEVLFGTNILGFGIGVFFAMLASSTRNGLLDLGTGMIATALIGVVAVSFYLVVVALQELGMEEVDSS